MTVYVDVLMNHGWKLRGHLTKNCHMFTDGDIEELHEMAEAIGMKRSWFQDKRIKHYDLHARRRQKAVELGAVEVSRREAVKIWQTLK
ncbi:DUF4031 domain-containing protein [Shigella flexneri]